MLNVQSRQESIQSGERRNKLDVFALGGRVIKKKADTVSGYRRTLPSICTRNGGIARHVVKDNYHREGFLLLESRLTE
jgi:hypothetical protein